MRLSKLKRERGTAIVEAVIALPVLLAVILGAIQFGLIYEAKASLNHAALQAARAAAVNNAQPAAICHSMALGLAPLYSPQSSIQGAASTVARLEAALLTDARIRILNPTREAFADFGEQVGGETEIPNDRLHVRSNAIGSASAVSIQDANLLKLEVTYGYELKVPLVNWFISRVLLVTRRTGGNDAFEQQLLRRTRLPIIAAATVRLQSPARLSAMVASRSASPEFNRIPANARPPRLINESPNSGEPGGEATDAEHAGVRSSLADGFFGFGSGHGGSVDGDDGTTGATDEESDDHEEDVGAPPETQTEQEPLSCTPDAAAPMEETRSDESLLGQIWSELKNLAGTANDFVLGFWEGIKSQVGDLVDLITDPIETAKGLYRLAQSFIDDPASTAELIGEALGKDLTQLAFCGAYDRGQVLGSYISPAFMLKLTAKLAKFHTLERALDELKKDFGCASFAAGTPVWTDDGLRSIDQLSVADSVASRDAETYRDAEQRVERTFERNSQRYYALQTEAETFRVTEEHPFWVQGRGWIPVRDLNTGDVLATVDGDVLVLQAIPVASPIEVFNLSVSKTGTYFVGRTGLWAHNANCDISVPYRAPKSPSGYRVGASDGGGGQWVERGRPDSDAYRYQQQITGAPRNGTRVPEYEVNGVDFDGYDAERNVLIDAKHYTEVCPLADCKPEALRDAIADKLVAEARRQIDAVMASSAPEAVIEWHVVNKVMAEKIDQILSGALLGEYEGKITVIFTPDVVN